MTVKLPTLDKIFIKGLMIEAVVGIYPHERTTKQPLLIDIDLYTDISSAAKSKSIADTIDYDRVVNRVCEIVKQGQFELLESLISSIADALLAEFPAEKIHCTVCKPQAISKVQTVGVSIIRNKC